MIIIGPLTFHLYGLMIGLGVLLGAWAAIRVTGVEADEVWDALVWGIVFGLVGARAYHVIDLWSYYSVHLNEIVMVWKGGMGIFGGMLGGFLGLWIFTRRRKVANLLFLLDVGGVGLPVGQAIGRWGNYFNQELYGKPTDLPWGIFIRPENRLLKVMDFERFHPLFLYESILCLVIFLILWGGIRRVNKFSGPMLRSDSSPQRSGLKGVPSRTDLIYRLRVGTGGVFLTYLGLYGLVRFFLEFLRIDPWMVGEVNVAQAVSVGLVFLSLTGWVISRDNVC